MKRKICIVTGTRADWGLLSPIAAALRSRDDVDLQIVATNMHLMPRFGMTVDEIKADGFDIDGSVKIFDDDADIDSPLSTAQAMGRCLKEIAPVFDRLKPDMVVLLGDRFEMLAVASAAAVMRIPIVHLHGGEITEGAIDNSIRNAITSLASLQDGLLNLTVVAPFKTIEIPVLATKLLDGRAHTSRRVQLATGRHIVIRRSQEGPAHVDGDPCMKGTEIVIDIVPAALKVVVPRNRKI